MTSTDTSTTASTDLRGRVVAAAMRFLDRTGHYILEAPLASTAGGVDVITEHEGALRFIDIRHVDDPTEFRAEGPSADVLTAIVFGERALIEYHHGAHCQQ